MGVVIIEDETTLNPISTIGKYAGICYGADITNQEKNYKRGLNCLRANHGRTLEYVNVYMVMDKYSAKVMREFYTHIGGAPTRLQESTRYVSYKDFKVVTPPTIMHNSEAKKIWDDAVESIRSAIVGLDELGIPREDSSGLLPLDYETKVVVRTNLRNLIDMSHVRMCSRAYWEFRKLMNDICNALEVVSDEWYEIIDRYMVPKCELTGYCLEEKSCGRKPKI